MKIVYSQAARSDIDLILETSEHLFGESQATAYALLISRTIELITEQPVRPSSRDLSDILPDLRALHLAIAAGARRRASHHVLYRIRQDATDAKRVEIVRVLHQAMDTAAHIERGLRD